MPNKNIGCNLAVKFELWNVSVVDVKKMFLFTLIRITKWHWYYSRNRIIRPSKENPKMSENIGQSDNFDITYAEVDTVTILQ